MIGTVKIRPMTPADAETVAGLEAQNFTDAWSANLYKETIESGRYDCQVLEQECDTADQKTLLGYFCGQVILDEAEVHRIAVDPRWRRAGLGELLLDDFLCRTREAGVVSVLLEVRAGNVPAIGLYEKKGFQRIAVRHDYYQHPKEDAWIMQKSF